MKKFMVGCLVIFLLAIGGLIGASYSLQQWAQIPMQLNVETRFDISRGTTLYSLAKDLESKGWIADARWLRWYARISDQGHLIQAGEYLLMPGLSPQGLIEKIQTGDVLQHTVTLVNGHTFEQFKQVLYANLELKKITEQWSDEELLSRLGAPYSHPEGLFYPDTYQFKKGDSDFDILQRAYNRMTELLALAWQQKAPDLPYKNAYEALIMASIVEKETAVPSERTEIAGVFVNRLNRKMRLQTDPTVIYGIGQAYQGNITRKHLKEMTPYNTYRISGLPPTPIANPALPAIEAALHPAQTEALYFVAKGDGSHYFSTTLKQHTEAVKRYQWQRRKDYRSTPAQAIPSASDPKINATGESP